MENKGYTNKGVAEKINMKPSTVAYYTNKGFITPEIANPPGRGTTRRYSKKNLAEFLLILELQRHGMSLEKIRKILELIGKHPNEQFEKYIGEIPEEERERYYNYWDVLNFDDIIVQQAQESYIIIYNDADEINIDTVVKGKRKTDEEFRKLSMDDRKKYFEGQYLPINMNKNDSALVINITSLWNKIE